MPSSVVDSFEYDIAFHTLCIRFVSKAVYCYFGVPEAVYKKLKKASSRGTFFNRIIKGKYEFVRIS